MSRGLLFLIKSTGLNTFGFEENLCVVGDGHGSLQSTAFEMISMQVREKIYLDSVEIALVSGDVERRIVRIIRGGRQSSSNVMVST